MADPVFNLAPVAPEEFIKPAEQKTVGFNLAPADEVGKPKTIEELGWQVYRTRKLTEQYNTIKAMGATQYGNDEKAKEEDLQKLQLSFFLAERAGVEPVDVHKAWDSRGWNPYAEDYFKSKDLPSTWWGLMKDEFDRTVKTYRQLNLMSKAFFSGMDAERLGVAGAPQNQYDTSAFQEWEDIERSKPEPGHLRAKGLGGWLATIPYTVLQQAPYMADLFAAEGAGALLGAAIGTLAGGPAGTAIGSQIGRQAVGFLEASRIGSAQIFQQIMTTPDPETGEPLWKVVKDPAQVAAWAKVSSAIGGILTAVPMTLGIEATLGKLAKKAPEMGLKAIENAAKRGTVQTQIAEFLKAYGKNVGVNTMAMPVQNIINQVAADAGLRKVNERTGEDFPIADWQTYGKLITEGLSVGLQTGAIFSIPGSISQARGNLKSLAEKMKIADKEARAKLIDSVVDTARPLPERQADIDTRLKELNAAQEALASKMDAAMAKKKTPDQKDIELHTYNDNEITFLKWLKDEQEIKQPGQLYKAPRPTVDTEAPGKAREPIPEQEPAMSPEDQSAVLRERYAGKWEGSPRPGETFGDWSARQREYVRAGDERNIVNPIDPTLSSAEKERAIRRLTLENEPIVNTALQKIAEEMRLVYGETAKSSRKLADTIIEKSTRTAILEKLPEHDVEHVRDTFRFKIVSEKLEDFGYALKRIIQETGAELVKVDSGKLFEPKEWGWRFAGADLRMPNGQLVEFYTPLIELEAAKNGGGHLLYDKWRDKQEADILKDPKLIEERREDRIKSSELYKDALSAALKRMGLQETEAIASWSKLKDSGFGLEESPTLSKFAAKSSAEGAPGAQTPPLRTSENPLQVASTLPSEGSRETNQEPGGVAGASPADRLSAIPVTSYKNLPSAGDPFKSYSDLAPDSPIVAKIRKGLPNLTTGESQGAAMLGKLLALSVGERMGDWFDRWFVPEIFSAERDAEIQARGSRGAIGPADLARVGKLIFYTTTKSNLGTWVHEMTHVFEMQATPAQMAIIVRNYGILSEGDNRERFADSMIAYMKSGYAPNAELRPVFDSYARTLNQIFTEGSSVWTVSDEIATMYTDLLSGQARTPKEALPPGIDMNGEVLFETRAGDEAATPQELRPQDFMLQSAFHSAIVKPYVNEQGKNLPDVSSRTTPAPQLGLRVGMWMVDDGYKGIYGREIAQLRELDPNTLQLTESDYTKPPAETNWESPGRGDDARRYAEWMQQGLTPPPITVVETEAGNLRVTDGHRRTAAAKLSGQKILAWVWPAMDHPRGLRQNNGEAGLGPVLRVGLTYEGATGRVWEADIASPAPDTMLYETRPGDKDPWILKSRAVVREKMRGPQPASNIKGMLESAGVKADEMEYIGLNDLLVGNKKFTPKELLDYIEANAIKVEEVIREDFTQAALDAEIEKQREAEVQRIYEDMLDKAGPPLPDYRIDEVTDEESDTGTSWAVLLGDETYDTFDTEAEAMAAADKLSDQANAEWDLDIRNQAEDAVNRNMNRADAQRRIRAQATENLHRQYPPTQYKKYTLPGEHIAYRELLITLPIKNAGKWEVFDPATGKPIAAYETEAQAIEATFGTSMDYAPAGDQGSNQVYQSPHWAEKNVLVHLRFDERIVDGKRILFIEEIQSDWHQAGKREGYKKYAKPAELGPEFTVRRITEQDVADYGQALSDGPKIEAGEWGLFDSDDEFISHAPGTFTEEQARAGFAADAEAVGVDPTDFGGTKGEIPDAPFKKTWPELGFRRALRWAAENGYDEVAWTTGEQQADRYDLAKQVDSIEISKQQNGSFIWHAEKDGKVVAEEVSKNAAELEGQIGKDLAKKADEQEPGRYTGYSGPDLKVGGEGMKAFYDRQMVDIAKKIAKKYGAKVGTREIGSADVERLKQELRNEQQNSARLPVDNAGGILDNMDQGDSYAEAIVNQRMFILDSANVLGLTGNQLRDVNADLNWIEKNIRAPEGTAAEVHSMEIPPAMRESVLEGQMLFEPGPHERSVREAVEKGWPVPDNVLQQYADRPWAKEEQAKREALVEAARTTQSFDEFFDWQSRSHPDEHSSEDYYRSIYDRAKQTLETTEVQGRKLVDAMDDETIRYTIGGFALVNEGQNPEAQAQLTQEMRDLGKRIISGEDPGELTAKVREQIAEAPDRWRIFFDRYLPDEVKEEFQASLDAVDLMGFTPVAAKVANERFTDGLSTPEQMEEYLLTVGSKGLAGKSKFIVRLAEKLESSPEPLDPLRSAQALREIRKNITAYREAWAVTTGDEMMLRQLQAELETAAVTEEARLLGENQRLRSELKKSIEAVKQTSLRHAWTQADLTKAIKQHDADTVRYKQDIAEAKTKLRNSVQAIRAQYRQEKLVNGVIDAEMKKRQIAKIRTANAAQVAILKERVRQVRDIGRQKLKAERDKALIKRYAEYINRPVNAGIADAQARQIEDIQRRIEYDQTTVSEGVLNRLREFRRQNPDAPMPSELVREIETRDPRLITAGEMAKLYEETKALRSAGRKARMIDLMAERELVNTHVGLVEKAIRGGKPARDIKGLGTRGALRQTRTGVAQKALWATWRMNRIVEMLDGNQKGANTAWLWRKINEATDETIRQVDSYADSNKKILADLNLGPREFGKRETIDGLDVTHGQMVGVYVYSQFDDTMEALVVDNHISEPTIANIIKALSPQEKRYGDWMIAELSSDADFDRLQAVQLAVSNTRMDRLPRYFPIQRQGLSGSPMLSDLARELLDMAGKGKNPRPRAGFLNKRVDRAPGVELPPMRLDAPAIYMDHINKREFYIANAILVKRLNRIYDSRPVKAALHDRYGDAMQPLVQKYIANYTNPNIYRAVEDYGEFARILRGNVGMSLIGSNVLTILKQLPDIPQIMIQAGPIYAMRAAAQFISHPRQTLETMWARAPQLKNRSYDRFIEELKTYDRNAYERVVRTVGEAGFVALKAMDTVTNVIGWSATYFKEMQRTGNENQAAAAATDFILRKRPAARAKDVAAIYRNPLMSWFLMFTNQINQQWNVLTYDIPQGFRKGLKGDGRAMLDAFMNVTALAVGAIGIGVISRKGVMTAQTTAEDLLSMLFGYAPFIGNSIEAAIRGKPELDPLNPFGGAYQVAKFAANVVSGAETERVMRDLQNMLFTAGGTLGFPVIQAKRIYRTIESGDPWDLVGGPPKQED
jgi:hypothetical protein